MALQAETRREPGRLEAQLVQKLDQLLVLVVTVLVSILIHPSLREASPRGTWLVGVW
jgi:hypothetical protein